VDGNRFRKERVQRETETTQGKPSQQGPTKQQQDRFDDLHPSGRNHTAKGDVDKPSPLY
jgi:hypothetical protein